MKCILWINYSKYLTNLLLSNMIKWFRPKIGGSCNSKTILRKISNTQNLWECKFLWWLSPWGLSCWRQRWDTFSWVSSCCCRAPRQSPAGGCASSPETPAECQGHRWCRHPPAPSQWQPAMQGFDLAHTYKYFILFKA